MKVMGELSPNAKSAAIYLLFTSDLRNLSGTGINAPTGHWLIGNKQYPGSKMDVRQVIGINIRKYWISLGISQEELAFKADLQQSCISSLERVSGDQTAITLQRVAKTLKIKPHELLLGEQANSTAYRLNEFCRNPLSHNRLIVTHQALIEFCVDFAFHYEDRPFQAECRTHLKAYEIL